MKSVEISEIYLWSILTFLESAEDLGYSKEQGTVREWFTKKPIDEMQGVVENLLDLIEEENGPN